MAIWLYVCIRAIISYGTKIIKHKRGDPMPVKSDRKNFTTTVSQSIIKKARIECIKQGIHLNDVLELKLLEFIEESKALEKENISKE